MNAYELLYANRTALEMMAEVSVEVSDIKYFAMYKEYLRLINEGHKKTYVMQYLSDEYGVAERTTYRIIDRLSTEVEM